jgi:hypothetical protein
MVSGEFGDAAIEEDRARLIQRAAIRLHVEGQHQLGEQSGIVLVRCRTADLELVADDGAAGFGRGGEAGTAQSLDERRLAGAPGRRSARRNDSMAGASRFLLE